VAKLEENNKEYRKFGISVGIAFLLLTALFWWKDVHNAMRVTGALGGVLLLGGLAVPGLLKWPYRGWMKFAAGAAWFNTRVILTLMFYLVMTPVGLLMCLLGKRPLAVGFDKNAESYWIRRERKKYDPVRSEKHF
jgi:Saxitoxin biosynthesis operon protein SxtJ